MRKAAERERLDPEMIRRGIAAGVIVLPANINHKNLQPLAIGRGTRVKVNANIGTSPDYPQAGELLQKLEQAIAAGADAVMDLSTVPNSPNTPSGAGCLPLIGTVPIYQAAAEALDRYGAIVQMTVDDLSAPLKNMPGTGGFITVHCGLLGR